MARRKKSVEQLEQEKQDSVIVEGLTKMIASAAIQMQSNEENKELFHVVALSDINLYKNTSRVNAQGKLKKGQIANVIKEINYTPVKMYKLDTGYYIIANQNIRKY